MAKAALVVACAVMFREDGCVLAALRPLGKSLGGQWEFPGGKVEPGESPAEALQRELQEELGITVQVETPLTVVRHDYGPFQIELHPFLVRLLTGTPHPHEHTELRWVTLPTATELDWAAADVPVLEELMAVRPS